MQRGSILQISAQLYTSKVTALRIRNSLNVSLIIQLTQDKILGYKPLSKEEFMGKFKIYHSLERGETLIQSYFNQ